MGLLDDVGPLVIGSELYLDTTSYLLIEDKVRPYKGPSLDKQARVRINNVYYKILSILYDLDQHLTFYYLVVDD